MGPMHQLQMVGE